MERARKVKLGFKKPNNKTLLILSGALLIAPVLISIFLVFGIIFTYTGSVPIGFYKIVEDRSTLQRGDVVSFCLSDNVAKMGLSREYIKSGICANGSEELIKEIIAVPGNHVRVTTNRLIVSDGIMSQSYNAPTTIIDKHHLSVYRFIHNGPYIAKGYWVYGYGDPRNSWDSRYYGEIPRSNIKHRLVALWQF